LIFRPPFIFALKIKKNLKMNINNKKTNAMKDFIKFLALTISCVLVITNVKAQSFYTSSNITTSYVPCANALSISYLRYQDFDGDNEFGSNDYLLNSSSNDLYNGTALTLFYQDPSNSNWIEFYREMDPNSIGGAPYNWTLSENYNFTEIDGTSGANTIRINQGPRNSNVISTFCIKPNGSQDRTTTVMWYSIPQSIIDAGVVKIKASGVWNKWGAAVYQSFNYTYTVTVDKPTAPSNVVITQGTTCGNVQLQWDNPVWACSGYSRSLYIYRNAGGISPIDYSSDIYNTSSTNNGSLPTTYTDATAANGVIYKYSIRFTYFQQGNISNNFVPSGAINVYPKSFFSTISLPNSGSFNQNYSNPSGTSTGYVKTVPVVPTNFVAGNNRCDSKVDLSWSWVGASPDNFYYQRATNAAFTTGLVTSADLDGNTRTLVDAVPTRGVTYYYKMFAKNNCGSGLASSVVTGSSIADPLAANITTFTSSTTSITVNWADNATNETEYKIERAVVGGGGVSVFTVPANTTTYTDNSIVGCENYTYKILAINDCKPNGVASAPSGVIKAVPDISTTMLTLNGSKGYFNNKVDLSWSINTANQGFINQYKIYRVQIGTVDTQLVASVNVGNNIYSDLTANAGVLYTYIINGEGLCASTINKTNRLTTIGFRSATGIVTGHIEYNGGVALTGAKVYVQQTAGVTGSSIKVGNGNYLSISDNPSIEPANRLRLETWFKPLAYTALDNIITKTSAFTFQHIGSSYVAKIIVNGTTYQVSVAESNFMLNQWNHLSIVYDGTALKLFANGIVKANTNITGANANGNIANTSTPIVVGFSGAEFKLDEFRYFSATVLDSAIATNYNRYLNNDEAGLKIQLHFDEGLGNYAYDGSKIGSTFNGNHLSFNGAPTWTNDIPTASQLSYTGITDNLGNYSLTGVRYNGVGENFTIVPSYLTHSFTPNSRTVYMGDLANVYNNQDFIDNSSFNVTGNLFYKGTSCPVPNASVKLDGLPVVVAGEVVITDAYGNFSLDVPIGNHFISVEKFGHTMESGRFPVAGTYNFQAPVTGIQFKDSTLRKLVGRVVGGLVEGDKKPGLNRSVNNIGQAYIKLVSPIAGIPCYTAIVTTNSLSGEYALNLPPLQYRIDSVYAINNRFAVNKNSLTNANQVIDLTSANFATTVVDTLRDNFGGILSIDQTTYNKRHDMIYRTNPTINVSKLNGTTFIGEDTLTLGSTIIPMKTTIANPWGPFGFPVFLQGKQYVAKINGYELYNNADNNVVDTVLLNGNVLVNNSMVSGLDPNANTTMTNGEAQYNFTCGVPNITTNAINSTLNYVKDIQIVVVPTGAPAVLWKPNITTMPTAPNYHAYVIGKVVTGTGVATQGPEKVDFILRDPPGSGSSATWSAGTATTIVSSYTGAWNNSQNISATLLLGTKASVGIGVEIETEVENNIGIGLNRSETFGKGNSSTEVITSNSSVSTREDADHVGAPADIFIGRSTNWLVGPTGNIELRDTLGCYTSGYCFGPIVNGKQLQQTVGYAIAKGETKTRFSYTQQEIEEVVIPTLQSIRKNILTLNSKYTTNVAVTDDKFGSNNDDEIWGAARTTTTPLLYEPKDTTGMSYTFRGQYASGKDTVRIINTQISLWKQALAQNEREKWKCVTNTGGKLVDNFTLGSAVVTNSYQTDNDTTTSTSYEIALGGDIHGALGARFGGAGVQFEASVALTNTRSNGTDRSTNTTTSFEYTLTDGDPNDIMSIDVYKSPEGTGNIFVTRGGQTMCPYEDAVVCHYYNPTNPNAFISSHTYSADGFETIANATVQREMPNIEITPAIQYNIPSSQQAIYQLVLSNQSPLVVNNDVDMAIVIGNNPNGAVVKIDGLNPATTYTVPTGSSVIKTLTVDRGPIENVYDSLMVIFRSACSADIADTAYISVHFIPTCTDLALITPTDNWVLNNNNNNMANITVSNYNYNYGAAVNPITGTLYGLNKIGIEFRPTNSSAWTEFNAFYKKPSTGQDTIPQNQVYSQYAWDVATVPDGTYELRAKSYCLDNQGQFATVISPVFGGVMDRINPEAFGTPSPADGILDPNDDIAMQFNETIDFGSLSSQNFDIRGVLNGTDIRHAESINFDGASNYMQVTGGASLQKRNFTIELWAKRNSTTTAQTLVSQGTDAVQSFDFGFNAAGKLSFKMCNVQVVSTAVVNTPTDWHHYAVGYNYANQTAQLYVDGVLVNNGNITLYSDYTGSGKLSFGKNGLTNNKFFNGNMHEVRLWNKEKTNLTILAQLNSTLSRNNAGLLYNWKMNEADGTVAHDDIRSRNADIYGATWQVNPNGNAVQFDGVNDNIKITAGTIPITKEMDFTLEFWFNSNQAGTATLFSNGKGTGIGADSATSWNVQKDVTGKLHVYHKGLDFVATSTNYFDAKWHHFALVLQRTGNLSAYVDGDLQNSVQANSFASLAGANMYLGARGYQTGVVTNYDNHYNGKLDEFRFWNTARKVEQVSRDKQNRLQGNEYGLQAYLPFENYQLVLGVPVLTPSNTDNSANALAIAVQNGVTTINTTPTIKLPRPVQKVNFTYSVNNDKIIFTPTTSPELLENVTLDVTVKDVYDLHGNKMQSPKTWIAYMNKNQVLWQDENLSFEKTVDSTITFVAKIANTGGASKAFTIANMPDWLTANVTTGNIAPNSTQSISFTIGAGGSIGNFNAGVTLTTDFGYDEVLLIDLKVKGDAPTWIVNANNFQYSMNVIGQLKIDGVIATNTENKIAAFKNNALCGVADLKYVAAYDKYEVFLNIYNNVISGGDSIKFKIYDAASGLTFVDVTPSIAFVENTFIGTPSAPITFVANSKITRDIPLNAGWTWVSFPLQTKQLKKATTLMADVQATNNDVIKSQTAFDQYSTSLGWLGNISSNALGYENAKSYRVYTTNLDTIKLTGSRINPDSALAKINVANGWNWIGYIANKNVGVTEALANYNAVTGDIIKSQYEFAYYDNALGWIGSLTHLKPTMGYMLKSTATSAFTYPLSSFFGRMAAPKVYPNTVVAQNQYTFVPQGFAKTMSVVAKGNICDANIENGNIVLGVFDANNALRGYAKPLLNATTNVYNYYITAYSNIDNEVLNFKYFDATSGEELGALANTAFVSDALQGTPNQPIEVNVTDSVKCAFTNTSVLTAVNAIKQATTVNNNLNVVISPNPFTNDLTINFNKVVDCKIELYDVLGKVLYSSIEKGKQQVKLNANIDNIPAGIYHVRITGDNFTEQLKVIKIK
jgi:hypothetical protein